MIPLKRFPQFQLAPALVRPVKVRWAALRGNTQERTKREILGAYFRSAAVRERPANVANDFVGEEFLALQDPTVAQISSARISLTTFFQPALGSQMYWHYVASLQGAFGTQD